MVISEIVTLLFYIVSIAFLPEYFGTFSVDGRRGTLVHQFLQISRSSSLYAFYGS